MKISELKELGLLQETMDAVEVDVGTVITNDEFNRTQGNERSYREAAVERLVKSGHPFHSNGNILYSMMVSFVKVTCPYCGKEMTTRFSCMNGGSLVMYYQCWTCKADAHLSVLTDGLSFSGGSRKETK